MAPVETTTLQVALEQVAQVTGGNGQPETVTVLVAVPQAEVPLFQV